MGYGDNAIVVYNLVSGLGTHWKLEDFQSPAQIDAFDKSTSSISWRGNVSIMDGQRRIYIDRAQNSYDHEKMHPGFILDLDKKTL